MARGSAKKPGEPKCRGCGGLLEGRPVVKVGGARWHRECAERAGKFIPREYRQGAGSPPPTGEPAAREASQAPAEETVEVESA